jgi:hypothetical protein
VKLAASDLGTTGSPNPAVTITNVPGPEQLAFDKLGNLWVACFDTNNIVELSAASLANSGAMTPLASFNANGALSKSFGLRFNPGAP